jgi:hypothetical protein
MSEKHWSAARLRHVADKQSWPVINCLRICGELLDISDQAGIAPVPVARSSHHLPSFAVYRKRHTAGEASF